MKYDNIMEHGHIIRFLCAIRDANFTARTLERGKFGEKFYQLRINIIIILMCGKFIIEMRY